MNNLTRKHDLFVGEYLTDLNAAAAYRRAGYSTNNSAHAGAALLKRPVIAAEVARRIAEREQKMRVDANEILLFLSAALRADIRDILNDDGTFRPLKEWPLIWAQMTTGREVDLEEIYERSHDGQASRWDPKGRLRKDRFKFMDRTKLVELLMRHTSVNALVPHTGAEGGEHIHLHLHIEAKLAEAREHARLIEYADSNPIRTN